MTSKSVRSQISPGFLYPYGRSWQHRRELGRWKTERWTLNLAFATDIKRRFVRTISTDTDVRLQTAVSRFSSSSAVLDLYSIVHVAEPKYYREIERRLQSYDIVLFELLVPAKLRTQTSPARLLKEVDGIPATRRLARSLMLVDQLQILNPAKDSRYYLADIAAEDFRSNRKLDIEEEGTLFASVALTRKFWLSRWLSASLWVVLWFLLPCPELGLLVRPISGSPFDGTQLQFFLSVVRTLVRNDLLSARRLSFAYRIEEECNMQVNERLVDSMAKRRNSEAIKSIRNVMLNGRSQDTRVAMVYGANHGGNLSRRIEGELGMTYLESEWLDAIKVVVAPSENDSGYRGDESTGKPEGKRFQVPILLPVLFVSYQFYCAIDWLQIVKQGIATFAGDSEVSRIFLPLVLYTVRHSAAYFAMKKWFALQL